VLMPLLSGLVVSSATATVEIRHER